jgi:hypothetical protein
MSVPTKPPRSEVLTDIAALDGVEVVLEMLVLVLVLEPVEDEAGPVVVSEEG